MTNYFSSTTIEDLKKEYKKLAKKYHPDLNKGMDTTKLFVEVNAQYEKLFARLKNSDKNSYQHKESFDDSSFRSIIDILIRHSDINIEIVGSWIWVSGNTYAIRGELKDLGFKFSKSNKKWYFGEVSGKKKKAMSWDKKVELYGVDTVQVSETREEVLLSNPTQIKL